MSVPVRSEMASTEAPTFLQSNLSPAALRYVPLPTPLVLDFNKLITVTASEDLRPPCRRCLLDASPGEVLYLIPYDPFSTRSNSPYRSSSPIFVHAHDCALFTGTVLPERQLRRLMSVRAYDARDMIMACEVVGGEQFETVVGEMLADNRAEWVGVYYAKPGCFAVRVERA